MTAAFAILGIVVLGVIGDYFLKVASGKDAALASAEFGVGVAFYAVSAAGIMFVMRHMSLASIGVWYAVLTVLFLTGLGIFVFKEGITWREIAGIVLAFGALGLTGRFT